MKYIYNLFSIPFYTLQICTRFRAKAKQKHHFPFYENKHVEESKSVDIILQ